MEQLLIDTKELQKILSVTKNTAIKFGDEAGARVMIGRALRWNLTKIQECIEGKKP